MKITLTILSLMILSQASFAGLSAFDSQKINLMIQKNESINASALQNIKETDPELEAELLKEDNSQAEMPNYTKKNKREALILE